MQMSFTQIFYTIYMYTLIEFIAFLMVWGKYFSDQLTIIIITVSKHVLICVCRQEIIL